MLRNGEFMKTFMKNNKGQGSMYSFFALVMGLIMLAAFLPVVNDIVHTIVNGNMSALSNSGTIALLVGMSGILMVLLFFMSVISDFSTGQRYINS